MAHWSCFAGQPGQRVLLTHELPESPPPALIASEIITDLLDADLHFDPLGPRTFAQTKFDDGRFVVTVNNLIAAMEGVKDDEGIERVAEWHEIVHIDRDAAFLKSAQPSLLPGFAGPAGIACHRDPSIQLTGDEKKRSSLRKKPAEPLLFLTRT